MAGRPTTPYQNAGPTAHLRAFSVLRSCSVEALSCPVNASTLSSSSRSSCWSAAAFLATLAASTSSLVFTRASATAVDTAASMACRSTEVAASVAGSN